MSRCQKVGRPIARSLRQASSPTTGRTAAESIRVVRCFSWTPCRKDGAITDGTTPGAGPEPDLAKLAEQAMLLDPNRAASWKEELQLMKQGTPPIGSRRRRMAIRTTGDMPFEQLPYQCFQEARKLLNEDRREKIAKILQETEKIRRLEATDPSTFRAGEYHKQKRLKSLRQHVEELKIQADINDPLVKRRFEDGLGDMSRPVYRYLAKRKWLSMDYKIIKQRLSQFHIVPDLLPKFEPTMAVRLFFRGAHVPPGQLLDSRVTETPPSLRLQAFDAGERLLSVVVLDADVPDTAADGFAKRCHFLAANVPWDPTRSALALAHVGGRGIGGAAPVPWLPAFSQKGAPYHRLAVFVLQQRPGEVLDTARLAQLYNDAGRDNFSLKSFRDRFGLTPVGFTLFRTIWDESTAEVMARHNIPGADVEFRPRRIKSLKPPKKARGWEAKRQKPKYKSLWKYTKRIA